MQMNKSHNADKANTRGRIKALMERPRKWGENAANALHNRLDRQQIEYRMDKEGIRKKRQALIGGMTNWQRNQAGRKCKGAWDTLSMEQLEHFAGLPHHKKALRS